MGSTGIAANLYTVQLDLNLLEAREIKGLSVQAIECLDLLVERERYTELERERERNTK